jgi:hypothetical protein
MVKSLLTNIGLYEAEINNAIMKKYIFKPETRHELKSAVSLWCIDRKQALIKYGHIGTWYTSLITDMSYVFEGKKNFNDDISLWDVSNVINMNNMFDGCHNLNKPLNYWNISNVTSTYEMFRCCFNFDQDLNYWDVSKLVNTESMFYRCRSFSHTLFKWRLSSAKYVSHMFCGCYKFRRLSTHMRAWRLKPEHKSHIFQWCDMDETKFSDTMYLRNMYSIEMKKVNNCGLCSYDMQKEIMCKLSENRQDNMSSSMNSSLINSVHYPHNSYHIIKEMIRDDKR